MMEMSNELKAAVRECREQPLRLVDPESNTAFVLLSEEEYRKLRAGQYDSSPWTDEEMELLAQENADLLGWQGMEVYQDDEP